MRFYRAKIGNLANFTVAHAKRVVQHHCHADNTASVSLSRQGPAATSAQYPSLPGLTYTHRQVAGRGLVCVAFAGIRIATISCPLKLYSFFQARKCILWRVCQSRVAGNELLSMRGLSRSSSGRWQYGRREFSSLAIAPLPGPVTPKPGYPSLSSEISQPQT